MRLAVYQPDIAPNLGTMIRLSACLGVPLDIIEPCGFPLSIKSLRRAAMDYADIADLTRHDDWNAFRRARTGRVILLTTKAENSIWTFDFRADDTLLMGRESAGVPASVHSACDSAVCLPLRPPARSLNVAVCAGIALAEALRQTAQHPIYAGDQII
jgi:tRNA (cytidine/uridine-2'-O-)-methyltransferase